MTDSQNDFRRAWNRLTAKGEMCGSQSAGSFVPAGVRKNVREPGPLYHGTKADLKPGDLIMPGYPSNYGSGQKANFVYVTALKQGAALAAELAKGDGPGRVYIVDPTGPLEDDPNVTDQKFPGNPTRSYRTREPLRITGEISDWEKLDPEVLEKIRRKMKEAALAGIEAINE